MSEQNQQSLAPVSESSRIDVMDILRGFALIGIVFMNIEFFNRSGTDLRSFDTSLTGLDHTVGWLVRAFIEGKFYKLFALLFGMGFAVMLLRAREVGRPFGAWFVRRMLVLLAIGMAHNVLIWDGDILHDYAFAGLVFLGWIYLFQIPWLQRFNTPSAFLKIGILWLLLPFLVMVFSGIKFGTQTTDTALQEQWQEDLIIAASIEEQLKEPAPIDEEPSLPADADESDDAAADDVTEELTAEETRQETIDYWVGMERKWDRNAEEQVAIMSGDSYTAAVRYRASFVQRDAGNTLFFTAILLMPIYLVGYWFVASGILRDHRQHKTLFRSLAIIGLVFGTISSVAGLLILQHPASTTSELFWAMGFWLFNLGQLVLAAGYLGLIVCLVGRTFFHRILGKLAPFGRMALTNYIMQSIILVSLFHGYAGGLYGKVSRSEQVLVVIAIVTLQILFSSWWLKRFRFGPLEWLWRSATYMSWQPLRV